MKSVKPSGPNGPRNDNLKQEKKVKWKLPMGKKGYEFICRGKTQHEAPISQINPLKKRPTFVFILAVICFAKQRESMLVTS